VEERLTVEAMLEMCREGLFVRGIREVTAKPKSRYCFDVYVTVPTLTGETVVQIKREYWKPYGQWQGALFRLRVVALGALASNQLDVLNGILTGWAKIEGNPWLRNEPVVFAESIAGLPSTIVPPETLGLLPEWEGLKIIVATNLQELTNRYGQIAEGSMCAVGSPYCEMKALETCFIRLEAVIT
jgi:hypothetical protein